MKQTLSRPVGDHFLTKMTKDFRLDALDFEAGQVLDHASRMQARRSLGANTGMKHAAGLGQYGFGAGQYLGQADRPRTKNDGVASLDDSNIGFPPFLGDPPIDPRAEPIRMECAVEHLKCEVGDPSPTGTDSHNQDLFLG
jgi:hypothetical protein